MESGVSKDMAGTPKRCGTQLFSGADCPSTGYCLAATRARLARPLHWLPGLHPACKPGREYTCLHLPLPVLPETGIRHALICWRNDFISSKAATALQVDAVEFYKERIQALADAITKGSQHLLSDPEATLPAAFVTFNTRTAQVLPCRPDAASLTVSSPGIRLKPMQQAAWLQ